MKNFDYFAYYQDQWKIIDFDYNRDFADFHNEFIAECIVKDMIIYFAKKNKKITRRFFRNYIYADSSMFLSEILDLNFNSILTIHLYINPTTYFKLTGSVRIDNHIKKLSSIILDEDEVEGKIIINDSKYVHYFYVNQFDGNIYLFKRLNTNKSNDT